MDRKTRHKHRWVKALVGTFAAILALAIVLVLSATAIWHDEIKTITSVTMLRDRFDINGEGAVYTMNVSGGFYLDDFVAQGGVANDQELVDFVVKHFTKGLIDLQISVPVAGCSAFTAGTVSGDYLFGRNYDSSMTNLCIVFTEANKGRHATITSVDLKYLGIDPNKNIDTVREKLRCIAAAYAPVDGMNDAGVACAILISCQNAGPEVTTDQQTERPDFTPSTLVRLILDYADDLEEAIEIASSYDMHDSAGVTYHYMVADASGRSAILEWIGETDTADYDGSKRTLKVTYSDSDDHIGEMEEQYDAQVVTNFIIYGGYYADPDTRNSGGYDRYQRIWKELDKAGGTLSDEQEAMDILQIVGIRNWAEREGTAHSVVFNLTDRTMLWIPNENFGLPSAEYVFDFITK